MARDTLPRGVNLLALAGSTATPTHASLPEAASEADEAVAHRRIGPTLAVRPSAKPAPEGLALLPADDIALLVPRRQKVNARITAALLDEVRDCAVALSGPPHGLTMDQFAEEAYRRELERLKRVHASGKPFAKRPYNPKPGRRVA
jgi:hypothetical protein